MYSSITAHVTVSMNGQSPSAYFFPLTAQLLKQQVVTLMIGRVPLVPNDHKSLNNLRNEYVLIILNISPRKKKLKNQEFKSDFADQPRSPCEVNVQINNSFYDLVEYTLI